MSTNYGAAWQHGGLPPWMEFPPGFDEAHAADRLDDLALAAELTTERFGTLGALTRERPEPPAPPRRPAADTPDDYTRRREVLCDALDPPSPLANLGQWAA